MSREEFVFSKKAIVVVSVISVIGSNVVIGFMAAMWLWRFSDQIRKETTFAATEAAKTAVVATVQPIREDQIRHSAIDAEAQKRVEAEIAALKNRQDKLEDRINHR